MAVALQAAKESFGSSPEAISAAVIGGDAGSLSEIGSALAEDPLEIPVETWELPAGRQLSGAIAAAPPADAYVTPCDLGETGSLVMVETLASSLPAPLVLIVAGEAKAHQMKAALRAGAAGLVREAEVATSLAATVRAVIAGQLAIPRELGLQIDKPVLSRRQKQVIGLVVIGLNNGEIAAKLHLSEHTVKCHLYAAFRKLGVSSREEAVSRILDPTEGLGTGVLAISGPNPGANQAAAAPAN